MVFRVYYSPQQQRTIAWYAFGFCGECGIVQGIESIWCAHYCVKFAFKSSLLVSKTGCYANCFHCRHYRNVFAYIYFLGGCTDTKIGCCVLYFHFVKVTESIARAFAARTTTFIKKPSRKFPKSNTFKLSLFKQLNKDCSSFGWNRREKCDFLSVEM